ncbi:MAG: DNA/RNA non-specific endonuclease [Bacteroidales bacterium]|nr:DNA/RNA non-specific endonuclease [Bacteroidales bacterium]
MQKYKTFSYLCIMKPGYTILLILLSGLCHTAAAQSWLPDTVGCDCQVVRHEGYTLLYDESHEQARWVAYLLTRDRLKGDVPRRGNDKFLPDTTVVSGSALSSDYSHSGYSRGHLAPAADMKWSVRAMRESFLMSNISPQTSEFNDGIWQRAEKLVRRWAETYDSLYVITGPVLDEGLPTIGHQNHISIPRCFYKVIYDPKRKKGIALLIEHENSPKPIQSFAVTIDEVESTTGIDFFPGMDNEEQIESTLNLDQWLW